MRGWRRFGMLALVLVAAAGCASQARLAQTSAQASGSEAVLVWDCGWRVLAQP